MPGRGRVAPTVNGDGRLVLLLDRDGRTLETVELERDEASDRAAPYDEDVGLFDAGVVLSHRGAVECMWVRELMVACNATSRVSPVLVVGNAKMPSSEPRQGSS